MSFIQRLFKSILPPSWAESMEADSRAWKMRCPNCGYEQSIWDMGGIRWKATGNPRSLFMCRTCGKLGWHKVYKPA